MIDDEFFGSGYKVEASSPFANRKLAVRICPLRTILKLSS